MIEITVNGKENQFVENILISDLLDHLKVSREMLIVTVNGEVINRDCFGHQIIGDGDAVELIRLVGGG